jgi:hypothetical protein
MKNTGMCVCECECMCVCVFEYVCECVWCIFIILMILAFKNITLNLKTSHVTTLHYTSPHYTTLYFTTLYRTTQRRQGRSHRNRLLPGAHACARPFQADHSRRCSQAHMAERRVSCVWCSAACGLGCQMLA